MIAPPASWTLLLLAEPCAVAGTCLAAGKRVRPGLMGRRLCCLQVEKRLEHALIKGIDEFAVVGEQQPRLGGSRGTIGQAMMALLLPLAAHQAPFSGCACLARSSCPPTAPTSSTGHPPQHARHAPRVCTTWHPGHSAHPPGDMLPCPPPLTLQTRRRRARLAGTPRPSMSLRAPSWTA
jgi:hypothetical protein